MKVLITGFEPFANDTKNPSWEAVQQLKDHYGQITVIKKQLPVVFHESIAVLKTIALDEKPDIIICVGVASNRSTISCERVAINIDDAKIPDNKNQVLIDQEIIINGPGAYFSTLPIKAIYQALNAANILASISNTAGTYVCNHVMYGLLHLIKTEKIALIGGFIHVPAVVTMELTKIVQALKIVIEISVTNKKDISLSAGQIA